ncbi:MAG TPA: protein-glutamate O-methyltransferase CheR, partial [Candidatus Xenobia bacterium]
MNEAHRLIADAAFGALQERIIEQTGLAYYRGREQELAMHVGHRMAALGVTSLPAYLQRLSSHAELDTLAQALTIGETYFFRYQEQFDALRDRVLPELILERSSLRRLRIWSAGCATGPETYSLSILLQHDFGARLQGWDVQIVGTDINREFLARAEAGIYVEWAFRGVPDAVRAAFFERNGETWRVRANYRNGVHFQYHNLVTHPFPSLVNGLAAFDIILCRNVFIYFDLSTQHRLIRQFTDSLVDGGWLLVGHAESNLELFRGLETVSVPGSTLYRKAPAPLLW